MAEEQLDAIAEYELDPEYLECLDIAVDEELERWESSKYQDGR